MSKYDLPAQCELCQNRILNVEIEFSDSVRMSKNEKRITKSENQTNFTLLPYSKAKLVLSIAANRWRSSLTCRISPVALWDLSNFG